MTITVSIFNEISHGCDPVLETESYHDTSFVVNQQCFHHDNSRVSAQEGAPLTTTRHWFWYCMMTSSNGNIFRLTGHLCGEFTGSFHVFFDLRLNKPLSKQSLGWWFETLSHPLWRHCNDLGTRQVNRPLPDELQRLPAVFACASPSDALLIDCG